MKKVLSLVLSAAMMVCIAPSAVLAAADTGLSADSAADIKAGSACFSDDALIQKREAVTVLQALGLINGMGDGSFQPQGSVTRAQTAKLISVLVRKGDQTELLSPLSDPFDDVSKDHWASPYISYGVENGYINGMGDGTFDPEGMVTTAHLATILDKILGYETADVNSLWPDRAMAIAEETELLAEIDKNAGDFLSREEAAQMIFNALKADTKVLRYQTDSVYYYNTVQNAVTRDYQNRSSNTTEQLVEKLYPEVNYKTNRKDSLGRKIGVWRIDNADVWTEQIEEPDFSYTRQMSPLELQSDLKDYNFEKAVVYINGGKIPASAGYIRNCEDLAEVLTGNGILVEVYANEESRKVTKIVAVKYSLKDVSGVNSAEGKLTVDTGSEEVSVSEENEFYSAVSGAVKGDKILIAPKYNYLTYDGGSALETEWSVIIDAYMPELFRGAVTEVIPAAADGSGDGIAVIGGMSFLQAPDFNPEKLTADSSVSGTAYFDRYGYLEGYSADGQTYSPAEWLLVKSVDLEASGPESSESTWHVRGVSENGKLLNLTLNARGTEEALTEEDSRNTAVYERIVSTARWLDLYRDMLEQSQKEDGRKQIYLNEGAALAYYESAGGYFLAEEDTYGERFGYTVMTEGDLSARDSSLNGAAASDSLKIVQATGTQWENLCVSVINGAQIIPAASICILKKQKNGQDRIITAFSENESYRTDVREVLIRITGTAGMSVYRDANGDLQSSGMIVTYYDSGSAAEKTMIVPRPSGGIVQSGWYTTLESDGEASIPGGYISDITTLKWDSTTKSATGGYYTGRIESGYENMISVQDGTADNVYYFEGEEPVRDLSGQGIATVEELVSAVADGSLNNQVAFAYSVKNGKNMISQLYILN